MTDPNSITHPRRINAGLRRKKALELRLMGYSFQEIADTIIRGGENNKWDFDVPDSYDKRNCWKDVDIELKSVAKETFKSAEDVLATELLRLEMLQRAFFTKALEGDNPSLNSVLRIMDRRADLLGLKKIKDEMFRNSNIQKIITLYNNGEIGIQEIEEEFGEEIARRVLDSRRNPRIENSENKERVQ